jgi:hypothetical protein
MVKRAKNFNLYIEGITQHYIKLGSSDKADNPSTPAAMGPVLTEPCTARDRYPPLRSNRRLVSPGVIKRKRL